MVVRCKFNRRVLCFLVNFISVRLMNWSSFGSSRFGVLIGRCFLCKCSIIVICCLFVGFVKVELICVIMLSIVGWRNS